MEKPELISDLIAKPILFAGTSSRKANKQNLFYLDKVNMHLTDIWDYTSVVECLEQQWER